MDKRIVAILVSVSILSVCILTASADSLCPYDDDYKYVLKKALVDYVKDPSKSQMQYAEVKQMLSFYLRNSDLTEADCSQGNINALVEKADSSIPDTTMSLLNGLNLPHCDVCPDGALCGEENAKGQTCTCKDTEGDQKYEFCFLKPVIPPRPTCEVCPDGTLCGEKNVKEQTCKCKDVNKDDKYEYCRLIPLGPNCVNEGGKVPVGEGRPECCQGLTEKPTYSFKDGQCIALPGAQTCIKCGDGVCGPGEDKCNCPKDCPQTNCAKEGEKYSEVYTTYPKKCCEGLTAWMSGMDTREVVNGICVKTDKVAGSPVGTCIKCGDGICNDANENKCNCPKDCQTPITPCRDQNAECSVSQTPCCQGLTQISLSMKQNGQCITAACGTMCKPCGNGKCDQGENECNCPKDCAPKN